MQIGITTVISILLHAALIAVLSSGFFGRLKPAKNITALQARLMLKEKPRDPELLPRKDALPPKTQEPSPKPIEPPKTPPPAEKKPEPKAEPKSESKPESKPVPKLEPKLASKPVPKPPVKAPTSYARELARLSESFAAELSADAKEHVDDISDDGSYFDQIYLLIKKSFVVPAHINGPRGQSLQAVLRLFLSANGNLARLILEQSSGDDHFDKAVMDGTRRVNNFGAVPLALQRTLSENGVIVEMCPFKCQEQRHGG
jgi:outer membrane biosynthesis protein TonB